jgi:hypothetical protein
MLIRYSVRSMGEFGLLFVASINDLLLSDAIISEMGFIEG